MLFGISGLKGSFSEKAAKLYLEQKNLNSEFVYLKNSKDVFSHIEKKEIDLGIFPIANTIGGLVQMSLNEIGNYLFQIKDTISIDINHYLLSKEKVTDLSRIEFIYSHEQALKQCSLFLKEKCENATQISYENTSIAAKDLSIQKLNLNSAVIASKESAEEYNLHVVASEIQNITPNKTYFLIISAKQE